LKRWKRGELKMEMKEDALEWRLLDEGFRLRNEN